MKTPSAIGDDSYTDSVVRVGAPVRKGDVLDGRYVVEDVLGMGGMGVVVAATHVHLGARVALKFLLPGPARDRDFCSRFLREARAARRVTGENVARVLDVGELESGAPYMVMEYLEGSDLSKMLKERGPLPVTEAVDYLLQAAEALAEVHRAGIVHRDLKPANLFLTERADGTPCVKVLDFGISKALTHDPNETDLTKVSSLLGSPHYMSPEQIRSTKDVDTRSDIWSMGVILFQLLTGRSPFTGESPLVVLGRIVGPEPAPRVSSLVSGIRPALDDAIAKALVKDREERHRTVADFARALAPFGSESARRSVRRIAKILREERPFDDDEKTTNEVPPHLSQPSLPPRAVSSPSVPERTHPSATFGGASLRKSQPLPNRRWLAALFFVLLVGFGVTLGFSISARRDASSEPAARAVSPAAPAVSIESLATPVPEVPEPIDPAPLPPVASVLAASSAKPVPVAKKPRVTSTQAKTKPKTGGSIDSLIDERK